ncbi:MAG: FliH/SctL family protein [Lachnospiraceae bacterium]
MRSLSNLYKNLHVHKPENSIRIINSDELLRGKMSVVGNTADHKHYNHYASEVPDESRPVYQEQLLRDAQIKAAEIIEAAQKKAEEITEQAERNGYEDGISKARSEADQKLTQEMVSLRQETDKIREQLIQEHQVALLKLEPDMLDVILKVLEKAIGIHFEDKKELLLHVVHNTVSNIKGCRQFQIRVNDSQRAFLEEKKETIRNRIGSDVELYIISDSDLEKNQCLIETETGIFECGYDIQMKNLIRDLRTLSIRGIE